MRLIDISPLIKERDICEDKTCKECVLRVEGCADMMDMLMDLPTVEERKTGKWIKQPYMNGTWIIRCSNCMKVGNVGSGIGFKYCPNCGAKMSWGGA